MCVVCGGQFRDKNEMFMGVLCFRFLFFVPGDLFRAMPAFYKNSKFWEFKLIFGGLPPLILYRANDTLPKKLFITQTRESSNVQPSSCWTGSACNIPFALIYTIEFDWVRIWKKMIENYDLYVLNYKLFVVINCLVKNKTKSL